MEPLWSPVVATGGNWRQTGRGRNRQKQAKTVAVGCDRLRAKFHGKEGVDGSSPSECFEITPAIAGLLSSRAATHSALRVRDGYTRLSRCPRRRLFSPSQRRASRPAPTAPPRIAMLFLRGEDLRVTSLQQSPNEARSVLPGAARLVR